jgi:hypothetical protein
MGKRKSVSSTRTSRPPGKAGSARKTADDVNRESVSDADVRRRMIAEAAYFRAEARGFQAGDAVRDWLEAEVEVDAVLRESRNTRR